MISHYYHYFIHFSSPFQARDLARKSLIILMRFLHSPAARYAASAKYLVLLSDCGILGTEIVNV